MYARSNIRDAPGSDEEEEPSRSDKEIEKETIKKWQTAWVNSTKRRWTHGCVPNIKTWLNQKFGDLTYYTTQMLTNHGDFEQYLFRFGKKSTPVSSLCDSGLEDDAHYTIMACEALRQPRGNLGVDTVPALVELMLTSEDMWDTITRKIGCIFKKKTALRPVRSQAQHLQQQQATQPPDVAV